jgi:uncharacterized membrane protein
MLDGIGCAERTVVLLLRAIAVSTLHRSRSSTIAAAMHRKIDSLIGTPFSKRRLLGGLESLVFGVCFRA